MDDEQAIERFGLDRDELGADTIEGLVVANEEAALAADVEPDDENRELPS
jgi:hypothetical protein